MELLQTLGASFVNPSSHSCGAFSTLTTSSCVFIRILVEIFLQSHLGNLFSSRASSAFGLSLDFTTIEQHLSSSLQPNVKKCQLQQQFFDTNDWSTHSSQHEYPFALAWNCLRNNWLIDWSINSQQHESHFTLTWSLFNTHNIIGIPSSHEALKTWEFCLHSHHCGSNLFFHPHLWDSFSHIHVESIFTHVDMNPPLTLTYTTFFSLLEGLYNNGRAQLQLPPRGLLTLAKTLEKKEEEYNSTQILIIFLFSQV